MNKLTIEEYLEKISDFSVKLTYINQLAKNAKPEEYEDALNLLVKAYTDFQLKSLESNPYLCEQVNKLPEHIANSLLKIEYDFSKHRK